MHTRSSRQWQHLPKVIKSKRFCLNCQTIVEPVKHHKEDKEPNYDISTMYPQIIKNSDRSESCPNCNGTMLTKVVLKK